jgi:hypothetical protein
MIRNATIGMKRRHGIADPGGAIWFGLREGDAGEGGSLTCEEGIASGEGDRGIGCSGTCMMASLF